MDYRHHHLVSHHRHMVVEAASQRLGGCRHDEREEGDDDGNPYSVLVMQVPDPFALCLLEAQAQRDRKSTRLNSSHGYISYAVFCLKKKKKVLKMHGLITL